VNFLFLGRPVELIGKYGAPMLRTSIEVDGRMNFLNIYLFMLRALIKRLFFEMIFLENCFQFYCVTRDAVLKCNKTAGPHESSNN